MQQYICPIYSICDDREICNHGKPHLHSETCNIADGCMFMIGIEIEPCKKCRVEIVMEE